jgi:tetratricopeptide (TPR) repeat protein
MGNKIPPDSGPLLFDKTRETLGVAKPLSGDKKRQAPHVIAGFVYQAWCSIDAWLALDSSGSTIYLEHAEDYDLVTMQGAVTTQVRHTKKPLSLGNEKARQALVSFWELSEREVDRSVEYHYLTTSSSGPERDLKITGLNGIEAWQASRTSSTIADQLIIYLSNVLPADSSLVAFLTLAETAEVQDKLFRKFYWFTDQPDIETVKQSVTLRLRELFLLQQRPLRKLDTLRNALESHFWEIVVRPSLAARQLTLSEFNRLLKEFAEIEPAINNDQLHPLSNAITNEREFLDIYCSRSPALPTPLLDRTKLASQIIELMNRRKLALLTGTVFKGKTTLAQLIASTVCSDAYWLVLSGSEPKTVDRLFMALASLIESSDCPPLVVIDDLDVSPVAHRIYRHALSLVVYRAKRLGIAVLITAQGASSTSFIAQDFEMLELVNVPELSADEIKQLCIDYGCDSTLGTGWATIISAGTGGHPALVRVRIGELSTQGWPVPSVKDLLGPSPAIQSVRDLARNLLRDSVTDSEAELVYAISESHVPLPREVVMRLGVGMPGLNNLGDAIDKLTGKWLERVDLNSLLASSMLKGLAASVWPKDKLITNHQNVYDALIQKQPLDPAEAAALLFHAYLGQEPQRLRFIAAKLCSIDDKAARNEVEYRILWLTTIALKPEERIFTDSVTSSMLRMLQYRIAITNQSERLEDICNRWAEEVHALPEDEFKCAQIVLMSATIGLAENIHVPIIPRLNSISGLYPDKGVLKRLLARGVAAFTSSASDAGVPPTATTAQIVFLCATRSVRSVIDLDALIDWLERHATDIVRAELEQMIEWPVMQESGAFVQGAWAAFHESTSAWQGWLQAFERIDNYAKRYASPNIGREAAKAKAIVLAEYILDFGAAEVCLIAAEEDFGSSQILQEQWANLRFQQENYEGVLELWHKREMHSSNQAWDPFACRRAGISAARLQNWDESETIFRYAASLIPDNSLHTTKLGLLFDAANSASRNGRFSTAVDYFLEAVSTLPPEAYAEGNLKWDAIIRAGATTLSDVERRISKQDAEKIELEPGYASTPGLEFPTVQVGQAARCVFLQSRAFRTAATLHSLDNTHTNHLSQIDKSPYKFARYICAEAQLADSYANGASTGFIEALIKYDKSVSQMQLPLNSELILIPDEIAEQSAIVPTPENWTGLIAAGVICAGADLPNALASWRSEAGKELGLDSKILPLISDLSQNLEVDSQLLLKIAYDQTNPFGIRCGAATTLLWRNSITAQNGFILQGLLLSALMGFGGIQNQALFNRHVASRLLPWWQRLLDDPVNKLSLSDQALEMLRIALEKFVPGEVSIQALRSVAAEVTGQKLSDWDNLFL